MYQKIKYSVKCLAIILCFIGTVAAQFDEMYPPKRIHSPAVVRDFIGGEAHAVYVIRLRRGQHVTVRFSYNDEMTDDVPPRHNSSGFDVMRVDAFSRKLVSGSRLAVIQSALICECAGQNFEAYG